MITLCVKLVNTCITRAKLDALLICILSTFIFVGEAFAGGETFAGETFTLQQQKNSCLVIELPPLSPEEIVRPPRNGGPLPVGIHRFLPEGIEQNKNAWHADGKLWCLRIVSLGASSLRVYFKNFNVGRGRVWIYGTDGKTDGPYSQHGRYQDGQFWSAPVWGESLTIAYQPETHRQQKHLVPFQILKLSHSL